MSSAQASARMAMKRCPILRLSLSLMQDILRHLEGSRDILAACLCSSHLYDAGKSILYEAPTPKSSKSTEKLLETLVDKPELALGVDRLLVNPFDSPSSSIPHLCHKAIRLTHNLTELNLTALPTVPSLLGAHVIPKLTSCCLANTADAVPFLKANASKISMLMLADVDECQGIDQKIIFPKLDVAQIPLAVAPYVLHGSPVTTVVLSVTSDLEKRPAELKNFACLERLPITNLKVTSEHLNSDIIAPVARYTCRELQFLHFETTRPHTRARGKRFFETLEVHIALMRKLTNLVFPLSPGAARCPNNSDLNEMSDACEKLYKRCPTLKLIVPGLNIVWQPYDGLWLPCPPKEGPADLHDLLGMWIARKMMKNDSASLWRAMMQSLFEDPVALREFEESRGIKVAHPKDVPKKHGGEAEDPPEDDPMETIEACRVVEHPARGLAMESYTLYVLYLGKLRVCWLRGIDPRLQHIQPQLDRPSRLVRVRYDGQVLQLGEYNPLRLALVHRHRGQQRRVVHGVPVLQRERREPRERRHVAEEVEQLGRVPEADVEPPEQLEQAVDALLVVAGDVEVDHGRQDEVVNQVARVPLDAPADDAQADRLHLAVRDLPVRRVYRVALGRLPAKVHAQHVRHRRHDREDVRRLDVICLKESNLRPWEREAEIKRRTVEHQGLEVRCNLENAAHGARVADARRDEVQGAQDGEPPADGAKMVKVGGVHEEEGIAPAVTAADDEFHDALLAVVFAEDKEGDGHEL
ncbi:hypothetical protein FB107DRAFT_287032 [Schizophyllum commune]